jgi:hypothetical protein
VDSVGSGQCGQWTVGRPCVQVQAVCVGAGAGAGAGAGTSGPQCALHWPCVGSWLGGRRQAHVGVVTVATRECLARVITTEPAGIKKNKSKRSKRAESEIRSTHLYLDTMRVRNRCARHAARHAIAAKHAIDGAERIIAVPAVPHSLTLHQLSGVQPEPNEHR